jgi:hypothetical protein
MTLRVRNNKQTVYRGWPISRGAEQLVWFDEPTLFMDHDGTSLGAPGAPWTHRSGDVFQLYRSARRTRVLLPRSEVLPAGKEGRLRGVGWRTAAPTLISWSCTEFAREVLQAIHWSVYKLVRPHTSPHSVYARSPPKCRPLTVIRRTPTVR